MPAINSISADKLARLIGTPGCPAILDVRDEAQFDALPALVPGAVQTALENLMAEGRFPGPPVIAVCGDGAGARLL